MPKRAKPKSPEQFAAEKLVRRRKDLEAVGVQGEVASLSTGSDIEIIRGGEQRGAQRVSHNVARRQDAFDALRADMPPGAYDAARRLEQDMRERRGEADKGHGMMRVDCESKTDRTDAQIAAAERVEAALSRIGTRDAWLLTELIYPSVERASWKTTVAYVTGETNPMAQGAAVRAACANLAAAYGVRRAA